MRDIRKDFLALLDPDEPDYVCAWITNSIKQRSDVIATAETIENLLLSPLRWFIQESFDKHGRSTTSSDAAEALLICGDDIRYRFANQETIVPEQLEALQTKWQGLLSNIGWDNFVRFNNAQPDIKTAQRYKKDQKEKAKKGRSAKNDDGESVHSIIGRLALSKEHKTESAKQLWNRFYGELDSLGMSPEMDEDTPDESKWQITYTHTKGNKSITFGRFGTVVSEYRTGKKSL